ncbi:hypothetical protein JW899_00880 [Candidatus Uhrbacteria bacterium]|nr:hypothetical protein [Candidatus Uhrbacteria bacterium]
MEKIIEILGLGNTVEFRNWGMNAASIGAVGTVAFTFIEGWGLWKQNEKIWNKKSGEAVSIKMFSYSLFSFVVLAIYGWHIRSLSSVFNGTAMAALYLPILIGLWRFRGFTLTEKIQIPAMAMITAAMIFTPWQAEIFTAVGFGVTFSISLQARELWKAKSTGAVEVRMLIVLLLATVFWVTYAFAIGDISLMAICSANLAAQTVTIAIWIRFYLKNRPQTAI